MDNVWILGGYQSDFARNLSREGHDFADLTAEVVDATLAAAKLDASDIGVVHVANAFGEMFARQGHLGRDARHRQRRAVGHPRITSRGRVRIGQRRDLGGDRRPAIGRVPHRPGRRDRTGEDRAGRHRRRTSRCGRMDRP